MGRISYSFTNINFNPISVWRNTRNGEKLERTTQEKQLLTNQFSDLLQPPFDSTTKEDIEDFVNTELQYKSKGLPVNLNEG